MNYIEMLNRFYDIVQGGQVSSSAQLLYHTLLAINNKCGWIDWFARSNASLFGLLRISEKNLINARNELKQLGLIDFVTSKKRGTSTKYRILYQVNYSTNVSTKEVQKHVQTTDLNKLKPKPKLKEYNVHPEAESLFEYLWEMYPSKKGKNQVSEASKKKLAEIGKEGMVRAIKRYREELELENWKCPKNGSTFFNGGYDDYLDENYTPAPDRPLKVNKQEKPQRCNSFNNFVGRSPDISGEMEKNLLG